MRVLGFALLGFAWAGAALLLGACQTTGYSSGERVEMECSRSPIQSSWNNAYTPSHGRCIRVAPDGADLMAFVFGRDFEIPGGQAGVFYIQALHHTYLENLNVRDALRINTIINANARNWGTVERIQAGGLSYQAIPFTMQDKPCVGFVAYSGPQQYSAGFNESIRGHACANRMTLADAQAFLSSLSFDSSRADGAPTKPIIPPPGRKAKPKPSTQPA